MISGKSVTVVEAQGIVGTVKIPRKGTWPVLWKNEQITECQHRGSLAKANRYKQNSEALSRDREFHSILECMDAVEGI